MRLYLILRTTLIFSNEFNRRGEKHKTARAIFSDIALKHLDWPEAVWDAWIAFEHQHGSVEELEACLDKVEKAQYSVNIHRAKVRSRMSVFVDSY